MVKEREQTSLSALMRHHESFKRSLKRYSIVSYKQRQQVCRISNLFVLQQGLTKCQASRILTDVSSTTELRGLVYFFSLIGHFYLTVHLNAKKIYNFYLFMSSAFYLEITLTG